MDEDRGVEEERCPGCKGWIIDWVCPACTAPIPGLQPIAPGAPRASAVKPGSPRVYRAVDVLMLVLCLYWVGFAVLFYRASREGGPGGGSFIVFALAVVTLFVGLFSGHVAVSMLRRSYNVQGQLALAAALGLGWGTLLTLLFEVWWLSAAAPFHLAVAVFALAGSRYFERSWV